MSASSKRPPALMVLLFAAVVVARVGIIFVVDSPLSTGLAWAALLGGLSMAALLGKRMAARALAFLCLVLGGDVLIQLLSVDVSDVHLVAGLLWAGLVIGVGTYVLRSAQVRHFYEQ